MAGIRWGIQMDRGEILDEAKRLTHGDRNKDLNSRVKQGAFKAKLDRDPNDVDYEKNKKECIHKPIINYSIYNSNKQLSEISGVD